MHETTSYHSPLEQAATLAAMLIFLGLARGVIALAVSSLAAAVFGSLVLWGALVLTVRAIHDEEDTKASAISDVRREYDSTISAMASANGLTDDMTVSHGQKVSELASVIARQMQVSEEDVQVSQQATVLADVGKLGSAQSMLS